MSTQKSQNELAHRHVNKNRPTHKSENDEQGRHRFYERSTQVLPRSTHFPYRSTYITPRSTYIHPRSMHMSPRSTHKNNRSTYMNDKSTHVTHRLTYFNKNKGNNSCKHVMGIQIQNEKSKKNNELFTILTHT